MSIVTPFLNQTITIEKYSSTDAYGEVTYASGINYPSRVDFAPELVKSLTGEQIVSSASIMLEGTNDITVRDRITLPDGSKPKIISISKTPDIGGTYVLVVVYV